MSVASCRSLLLIDDNSKDFRDTCVYLERERYKARRSRETYIYVYFERERYKARLSTKTYTCLPRERKIYTCVMYRATTENFTGTTLREKDSELGFLVLLSFLIRKSSSEDVHRGQTLAQNSSKRRSLHTCNGQK